jgi:hypothetical protein
MDRVVAGTARAEVVAGTRQRSGRCRRR